MTALIEASRDMRILIAAVVIILFLFFVILHTQQQHHHSPFRRRIVSLAGTALFFFVFVMLMFVRAHLKAETELSAFLLPFAQAPPAVYFAAFALGAAVLVYESIRDIRSFRSYISEYSILQAVNDLGDGLVIFDKNKRVVFANRKMHELSYEIFGQSLHRFVSFPEWIENGFCAEDVYCLPQFPHAVYALPGGEVWQLRRLEITVDKEDYSEFVASDITQQYNLQRQIEQKNALLKRRQRLIAESTKMIIENNVKEEQLAYKMRIHDSLGQCVTTVSHIMQDTGDINACARIWRETAEGLRTNVNDEAEKGGQRAFREQLKLIEQFGLTVKHEGPMPVRQLHAQIFRDAVRTAAINAVRHAHADILFVKTERSGPDFSILISDNGVHTGNGTLTEGGGLSSLRQKVERAGGKMVISTEENIKIHITLPPVSDEADLLSNAANAL